MLKMIWEVNELDSMLTMEIEGLYRRYAVGLIIHIELSIEIKISSCLIKEAKLSE